MTEEEELALEKFNNAVKEAHNALFQANQEILAALNFEKRVIDGDVQLLEELLNRHIEQGYFLFEVLRQKRYLDERTKFERLEKEM